MITKWCSSCHRETKHNEMKLKGESRCTFCEFPVRTKHGKGDHAEVIRRQQAAKPRD